MTAAAIFITLLVLLAPIIADRPARHPRNLAPIQLISALGAWALVLADAAAIAIGIRDRSLVLFCTSAAAVAMALLSMVRQSGIVVVGDDEQSLKPVIDDLKQLLGGAPRVGVASLDAVIVGGGGPGIGVSVRRGHVTVRVRRDVADWLESHRRTGGARADLVASFARFVVLHELAHVLNGDHRAFRFVRSVVLAQLMWVGGAVAAAVALVVNGEASVTPLAVAMSVVVVFLAQSLVARRFIAERERLADWRALQTLSPADAVRLLERRGRRRAVQNPTELEKLMTDMKVVSTRASRGLFSRLTLLVWPEGDDIHHRSERVAAYRAEAAPTPVLWAALTGMQCGFLSMWATVAAMLAIAPWVRLSPSASTIMMLAVATWISAPAATYCALRVDPARMSVLELKLSSKRVVAEVVFYCAFVAAALISNRLHSRFGLESMPAPPYFAVVLIVFGMAVGICLWAAGMTGTHDGGGELRTAPRSSWVELFPLLAGMVLLLAPLSEIVSQRLGMGSFRAGGWVVIALMSFGGFVFSTGMARSTNRALRVIAPMAFLDTPAPVYGFRVFWLDFYVDLSQTTLGRAVAAAAAVQLAAMPFFVFGAALLMWGLRAVFDARTALLVTFVGALCLMALILVIPSRYTAYSGPSARLLDTGRLQLFERLLEAARAANSTTADRLNGSLKQWLRNDAFPDALLPQPGAVWPLAPLLILVRLAIETGEAAVVERWRSRIEHALHRIVSNDSVAMAPRQPPSMYWTAMAATLIDEANLHDAFPFDRMLDRIDSLLEDRLEHGITSLVADIVAAWRLLRRHGRPGPDPRSMRRFVRSSSIVSRPVWRQSLSELVSIADLTDDAELRERLAPIVRSRTWESLQLNPRKDVLLLLDCYLAALHLGELDAHHAAAGVIVAELAERVSDELMIVVSNTRRRTRK